MIDSNSENYDRKNIRHSTFMLLRENKDYSAKMICAKLQLPYVKYGPYVNNLKSEWKHHYQYEVGLNCSSVHGWRGYCYVPRDLDRTFALDAGWQETKAKNRWLLWIDNRWIGRMMWFMNGRVNLHVKSPVSLGRIKQLVCNGFGFTGIIFEDKILEKVLDSVRPTGAHYVFDVGQNLPKKTIDYFNKDLGVKIRIGDKSHPKSVEVELNTPDWVDRLSVAITRFSDLLAPQMMPPSKQSYFQEYVV